MERRLTQKSCQISDFLDGKSLFLRLIRCFYNLFMEDVEVISEQRLLPKVSSKNH